MKNYKFTVNGNTYETEIKNVEDSVMTIEVNGTPYEVIVDRDIKPMVVRPAAAVAAAPVAATVAAPKAVTAVPNLAAVKPSEGTAGTAGGGGSEIKSPLPGTVISILVKEGDTIKAGDKVMVLEAMKMENNIDAEQSGVVKSIKVSQGDAVMEGDTLMIIG